MQDQILRFFLEASASSRNADWNWFRNLRDSLWSQSICWLLCPRITSLHLETFSRRLGLSGECALSGRVHLLDFAWKAVHGSGHDCSFWLFRLGSNIPSSGRHVLTCQPTATLFSPSYPQKKFYSTSSGEK